MRAAFVFSFPPRAFLRTKSVAVAVCGIHLLLHVHVVSPFSSRYTGGSGLGGWGWGTWRGLCCAVALVTGVELSRLFGQSGRSQVRRLQLVSV